MLSEPFSVRRWSKKSMATLGRAINKAIARLERERVEEWRLRGDRELTLEQAARRSHRKVATLRRGWRRFPFVHPTGRGFMPQSRS